MHTLSEGEVHAIAYIVPCLRLSNWCIPAMLVYILAELLENVSVCLVNAHYN